jgi:phosphomevalonate kinase
VTKECIASAPGKIVLSGEYAVLDGAPAICMAVNRRARAVVTTTDGDVSRVTASGYSDECGRFQLTNGQIKWLDGRENFSVVDAVYRAADVADSLARVIDLDTREFMDSDSRRKIGIGSSAAITIALAAAIKGSVDIATIARRAHAELQDGAGSGVDIACGLNGGLIEYRMDGASTTSLAWPDGLLYRVLWTGVAASTTDKLAQLEATVSLPSRVRLVGESEMMAAAWCSGDAGQIVEGFREYIRQLREFSTDHDLGIFDAGHDELWRAAKAEQLTYKPCGAGGGDIGILFGAENSSLDAFVANNTSTCTVLDCELSATGVRIGE